MGKRDRLRPGKSTRKMHRDALNIFKHIRENLHWLDPFTYADMLLAHFGYEENKAVAWPIYLITAFISAWLIYTVLGFILGTRTPAVIVLSGSMEPTFYRGDIMVLTGANAENIKAQAIELPFALDDKPLYAYAKTYCELKDRNEPIECKQLIPYAKSGLLPISKFETKQICFPSVDRCIELNKKGDVVVYNSDTLGIPIIHRAVVKIYAKDGLFLLTKGDSIYNALIDQEAGLASKAISVDSLEGKTIFMIPKLGYVKLLLLDDPICIFTHLPDFTEKCVLP